MSILAWLGCAIIAHASGLLISNSPDSWRALSFASLAIGMLLCALSFGSFRNPHAPDTRGRIVFRSASFTLWLAVLAFLVQVCLDPFIVRQPRFGWFSEAVGTLFSMIQNATVTSDGDLAIRSHEGALLFSPSAEKLGVPSFCALLVVGVAHMRLSGVRLWPGCLAFVAVLISTIVMRGAFNIARFSGRDDILVQDYPAKTELFFRPFETQVWLVGAALVSYALLKRMNILDPSQAELKPWKPNAGTLVRSLVGATISIIVLVHYASHIPPGERKAGRVLVDEKLSGEWEPSARRLTPTWFGDLSTYSFSSAIEWLGYHYRVSVNLDKVYSDALLAEYDVLIIKTPTRALTRDEVASIHRYIYRGGGILLIGDHTNLMGMSAYLNEVSCLAGIQFRYDSVMEASSGAFSVYERPMLGYHPAVRRVDRMEFMTSCSIQTSGSARPVMVVPGQIRQDHDYSNNSNFGSIYSDPRMDHGSMVLAAAGTYGMGRILAFSDSTVLSSFALFQYYREYFLVDAVAFLNTKVSSADWVRHAIMILSILCGICALTVISPAPQEFVIGVLSVAFIAGFPLGLLVTDYSNSKFYPSAKPHRAVPRISVLLSDTEAVFPPVLGTFGKRDPDYYYDTFLAAIPRTGVMPKLSLSMEEALLENAAFVLNPHRGLPKSMRGPLVDWTVSGGTLVVATRSDHVHWAALASYLEPLGASISRVEGGGIGLRNVTEVNSGSPGINVFIRHVGRGKLVFVAGTESWSRKRMGHAFDIPGAEARTYYQALMDIIEKYTAACPPHRRTFRIIEGN